MLAIQVEIANGSTAEPVMVAFAVGPVKPSTSRISRR